MVRQGAHAEEDDGEAFNRVAHLASTLTREELLSLDVNTILHRLFWEEPLARFEPLVGDSGPRFACSCSRERVGHMIRSLGVAEAESILAEQGQIEVGCDFCGAQYRSEEHTSELQYRFDPVDAAGLFTSPPVSPGDASVH